MSAEYVDMFFFFCFCYFIDEPRTSLVHSEIVVLLGLIISYFFVRIFVGRAIKRADIKCTMAGEDAFTRAVIDSAESKVIRNK